MSNKEKLFKKYNESVELMASKSRFGFFSLSPSFRAGITDYAQKKAIKDQNGRVKIQKRNFQAGTFKGGKINRQLFSYSSSVFLGDPFRQSLKNVRTSSLEKSTNANQENIVFKPAKLNKTLMSASYPYVPQKTQNLNPKRNRQIDGRVKTAPRNVLANNYRKLDQQKVKNYKYSSDPFDNPKEQRKKQLFSSMQKRGQQPWKGGNPGTQFFATNKDAFFDAKMSKKTVKGKIKRYDSAKINHQQAFIPSCRENIGKFGVFSAAEYIPQSHLDEQVKRVNSKNPKLQVFKQKQSQNRLTNKPISSKPSPSISCFKANLLRKMR